MQLTRVLRYFTLPVLVAIGAKAVLANELPEWTLYTPTLGDTDTFLVDESGTVVHNWPSSFPPGVSVYLAEDGAIIRTANDTSVQPFENPGVGGRIERIAWDGTLEWSYAVAGPDHVQHHDIEILPNGNILAIVWERFSAAEAIAQGRDPARVGTEVWSEAVFEIQPVGTDQGVIVWEWHAWDHLVQDFDPILPNYGAPSDSPGRIDINFGPSGDDWLHLNAIDYNAELDQIVLSVRTFSEIWIISHDPSDSGDLLYRWGNPQAYGRGTPGDQMLFGQHDPQWIPAGCPGAGHLTMFNNGTGARGYSSIDEINTGVLPDGTYPLARDEPYGPTVLEWTCDTLDGDSYFQNIMSGVHRLPNGNSLITLALPGDLVEVDEDCSVVWSHATAGAVFRGTRIRSRDPKLEDILWIAGDTNGDLIVNVVDLLAVLANWGSSEPFADVKEDGSVDVEDLLFVLSHWG